MPVKIRVLLVRRDAFFALGLELRLEGKEGRREGGREERRGAEGARMVGQGRVG